MSRNHGESKQVYNELDTGIHEDIFEIFEQRRSQRCASKIHVVFVVMALPLVDARDRLYQMHSRVSGPLAFCALNRPEVEVFKDWIHSLSPESKSGHAWPGVCGNPFVSSKARPPARMRDMQ